MSIVDAYVVYIAGSAVEVNGKWCLDVDAVDDWGYHSATVLMFNTKEEAENVVIGHHFLT